tara:strand:+ start:14690 stop:15202 length:513 start_codon:yes stop_codon:yes gene_type:complete
MLEEFFNSRAGERITSLIGFVFPFCQANAFFGQQVLCTTENATFNTFFKTHLVNPLMVFYSSPWNYLIIFVFMIALFDICVRKRLPLNLFTRFNIIQAILLEVLCTFLAQAYGQTSFVFKTSAIGELFCNAAYFGIMAAILYCVLMILNGRYARIPVISEGARLNIQRWR